MQEYTQFVANNPILFVLLGVILGLIIWTEYRRITRAWKEITPQSAVQLLNHEDALMLDVREDAEIRQGKILGAKHIPLSVLRQRVGDLEKNKAQPVIAYCRTGSRSAQASDILCKNEFTKVYNLKGGIMAWENASLPKSQK